MLFTSFPFLILLFCTLILYYIHYLGKFQTIILILSSFVFYSYYEPILLILLVFSFTINAVASYQVQYGSYLNKKLTAAIGVVLNLLLLSFFKYSPLVSHSFSLEATDLGAFLIKIPLPIGISFFTFEGISLLVDTYNSEESAEKKKIIINKPFIKHWSDTALFVSFFPHLVSGPILKAYEFFPQIERKYLKNIDWEYCIKTLITGYFLKLVLADNLKEQTFFIGYPTCITIPSYTLIIILLAYSFQIFSDFAGYSLIALGLAALFGYRLNINFNYPYISKSFAEFWQRWHISLSTFLKEYLYFPLGGNRKGKVRTYFNLIVVMFLGGLWHGAAWSYAIWGLYHGILLASERLLKDFIKIKSNVFTNTLSIIVVFLCVSFAWLMFRLPYFDHVIQYCHYIAINFDIEMTPFWTRANIYCLLYSLPVVLYHIYYLYKSNSSRNLLAKYEFLAFAVMLFLILTNSGVAGDFIYFQF